MGKNQKRFIKQLRISMLVQEFRQSDLPYYAVEFNDNCQGFYYEKQIDSGWIRLFYFFQTNICKVAYAVYKPFNAISSKRVAGIKEINEEIVRLVEKYG